MKHRMTSEQEYLPGGAMGMYDGSIGGAEEDDCWVVAVVRRVMSQLIM